MSDGQDCVVFSQNDLPNNAFPLMEDIRRQGQMIDVSIIVGDKKHKIEAHKLVLAATIPYFHAMFTHNMVESKQNEIVLDEQGETIDPDAFEALINFAYRYTSDPKSFTLTKEIFRESSKHSSVWKSRQKHDQCFLRKIIIFSVKSTFYCFEKNVTFTKFFVKLARRMEYLIGKREFYMKTKFSIVH